MKKITKAMQLVATSKMKYFQERALASRVYIHGLLDMVAYDDVESAADSLFSEDRKEGKVLFVLYSSDKGLCGSMNTRLFKGLLSSDIWRATPPEDRLVITIGRKASDAVRVAGMEKEAEWNYIPEKFTTLDIIPLVSDIVDRWTGEEERIRAVYCMVPHYKNAFTFYPICKQILPLQENVVRTYRHTGEGDEVVAPRAPWSGYMFIEPDPVRFRYALHIQIMTGIFVESFNQLKATEYSSRMMAMQNATEAAQTMIDQKTLVYNKIRQQMITQQISEIVNAAQAVL